MTKKRLRHAGVHAGSASSSPSSCSSPSPRGFGSTSGLFSMMLDVSPTIVGAIAMSLIIFTGNIDISAGTILGFVGFVAAVLAKAGYPIDRLRARRPPDGHAPGRPQRLDQRHLQGAVHRRDAGHEHGPHRFLRHLPAQRRLGPEPERLLHLAGPGALLRDRALHLRDCRGGGGAVHLDGEVHAGSARRSTRWAATGRPPSTRGSIRTGRC